MDSLSAGWMVSLVLSAVGGVIGLVGGFLWGRRAALDAQAAALGRIMRELDSRRVSPGIIRRAVLAARIEVPHER